MTTSGRLYSAALSLLLVSISSGFGVPVTFRVDMTASGFVPGSDIVEARGSFNNWSGGFALIPTANPNILTNTVDVPDAPGTVEYYKFVWNFNYELQGLGDRPFTLAVSAQTLPIVYWNDYPALPSATTNRITFRLNMSTQITLGNFDPTNDLVFAAGTFQGQTPWTSQMFQLTNSGANNLYIGTWTNDGNYAGTYEEFKFIITRFGSDNWESILNRTFILTNNGVLPVVYFNDIGNAIPVAFNVDMARQAAAGRFTAGFDIVECKGSFNGWLGGVLLTNDPSAANPNLFSGTTYVYDNPGSTEFYRFAVNGGFNGLGWETPRTTDGFDRSFIVPTNSLTLPTVAWSDWSAGDVLVSNTLLTFTVNMTNAVGTDSHPFDSSFDSVYLNADWLPWWSWGNPPPEFQLINNPPGSKLYTVSVSLPAGYAVPLCYKYSINSFDNEGGLLTNHVRFVRALGNYTLPMDTFGAPVHEAAVGSLSAGKPTAGKIPLTWSGRPGVHLQVSSTPTNPILWHDLPETDARSSTNYPIFSPPTFFRLFKP